MSRSTTKAWLILPAIVLLAACGKDKEPPGTPGGESPEDAVRASLESIRDGRFDMYWQHALPPADFATLRADWTHRDAAQAPVDPQDRARFETMVKRFTEPDAEKKLFADIRPTLVRFDRDYKDQMPLISGVGQSMALTAIDQDKDLSASQKRQLRDVVNVVLPWTQTVAWNDQAKAKQAIAIAVDTARNAHLSTPEALRALDFPQSMATYSTAWLGLKKLLNVYGLSLDKSIDDATIETLENSGASAHVKITYTVLDKAISTDTTLVLLDGRWYDSDLLQDVRAEHARLTAPAPATSAPAPAGTAATPAAPVADARTR